MIGSSEKERFTVIENVADRGIALPPFSYKSISVVNILGIPFHSLKLNQAVDAIIQFIAEKKPRQVVLSNAYTVSLAQQDSELASLLKKADLVLADGMSIIWGASYIGVRLPQRVAGPDLTEALCAESTKRKFRIFLMGSSSENLVQLTRKLNQRWPGIQIVGTYSPTMCAKLSEEENLHIIHEIASANPDILLVGMSCPKQEKWIAANLSRLPVPVSLGVGAAFDFLSGSIPRAPLVLQQNGLEWLYRLWREPRRLWKRYLLGNGVFLLLLFKQYIRSRSLIQ